MTFCLYRSNRVERLADALATSAASARAHEEQRRRTERLSALDRAKTTFFSNVSHEFRTPRLELVLNRLGVLAAGLERDRRALSALFTLLDDIDVIARSIL